MTTLTKPVRPIRLYRAALSGHAHRVELFLSLLGLPFQTIDVDLTNGQQRTHEYLAMNPFGQVPVIDDNGLFLYDSNAILIYLARSYGEEHWLPKDIKSEVKIQQWLSLAAGPVFNGPCSARLITVFGHSLDHGRAVAISKALFDILEPHFAVGKFALGDQATIADVAAYTYIAHAPEGGIDLAPYPAIRGWLSRVEALPGFVPMQKTKVLDVPNQIPKQE